MVEYSWLTRIFVNVFERAENGFELANGPWTVDVHVWKLVERCSRLGRALGVRDWRSTADDDVLARYDNVKQNGINRVLALVRDCSRGQWCQHLGNNGSDWSVEITNVTSVKVDTASGQARGRSPFWRDSGGVEWVRRCFGRCNGQRSVENKCAWRRGAWRVIRVGSQHHQQEARAQTRYSRPRFSHRSELAAFHPLRTPLVAAAAEAVPRELPVATFLRFG